MIGLASLALATLAFVGSHFALSHTLRLRLIRDLGEAGFTLLYSIVAFVTLGWMIFAWRSLDGDVPVWIAPGWWWPVASLLMLLASILLVGSLRGNPAFPHPGARQKKIGPATGVFAITRHPMNISFALWAAVHLSLWWTTRNLIVSGGILVLAIAGSFGQDRKKESSVGQAWRDWEARTSFMPFAALVSGRAKWSAAAPGWIAILGGLALWLAVVTFHAPTVSPIVWVWQSAS
ncbi:MAG: transporter [Alphaproteobacteria bacterium]|nr:transporter [Alphaproteobacteria bacterium]